jgi:pimeloyl-ACP methyl ester carboxylesterase
MNFIIQNLLISIGIFFAISTLLIVLNGKNKKNSPTDDSLNFEELAIDYSGIPEQEHYKCRDGANLNYYHYASEADKVLVLIHGSGWHSKYLFSLAKYISSENIANVYTPDLRGHGINPLKRGDIDYINQLEDDIADFCKLVKENHPNAKIIIGGHSSGGGLAIRFGGSKHRKYADAYLLLSPYLKYNAPTIRKNAGGWAYPHMQRLAGLSMLNSVGIRVLNKLKVIDFNMPLAYRDGTETLSYSYTLNTGYAPRNYKKDLGKINQKLLLCVGESDESFIANKFLPELEKFKKDGEVHCLKNVTHMGIVMGDEIKPVIKEWMKTLDI